MKKYLKFFFSLILMIFAVSMEIYAQEEIKANILLELTKDAELYENPDCNAAVVSSLEKGTTVFSKEESHNGWIMISYENIEGYVPIDNVKIFIAEGIDQEFERKDAELALLFSEYEYEKREKKQNIVWGIVIILLVISIFAVGIVQSVFKTGKNDNKEKIQDGSKRQVDKSESDYTNTML